METLNVKILEPKAKTLLEYLAGLNLIKIRTRQFDWVVTQQCDDADMPNGMHPPKRKGSLTEGFGCWADNAPFEESNYRDILWQNERNTW